MARQNRQRDVIVRRDSPSSGPDNMAIDEGLLADAKPADPIVVRLYQWNQPTLSLGHFQSIDQWREDPLTRNVPGIGDLPWVRRKTGGGAILHDSEWTYCIVIPSDAEDSMKGHSEALYRAVHASILDGLTALGWGANLSENCTCATADSRESQSFLCFHRRSPVDIVVGKYKIVGSAQRRQRTGLLQHGSVLIHSSSVYPTLRGLEQLQRNCSNPVDWPSWLEGCIRNGLREEARGDC
jgi:lipoate-protein ligase A